MKKVFIGFLIFTLLTATTAWALNKILVAKGAPLLFADTAQLETAALTLSALAAGTGCTTACTRCSALYPKAGANVKSQRWEMRPHIQLTGDNSTVLGQVVEFYVATSDGTNTQGAIAATDGTIDVNKRKNLTFVGVLIVDQPTTNTTMVAAFPDIRIDESHFQVCVSNQTALPFKTDTAVHGVVMTPMDVEVQGP